MILLPLYCLIFFFTFFYPFTFLFINFYKMQLKSIVQNRVSRELFDSSSKPFDKSSLPRVLAIWPCSIYLWFFRLWFRWRNRNHQSPPKDRPTCPSISTLKDQMVSLNTRFDEHIASTSRNCRVSSTISIVVCHNCWHYRLHFSPILLGFCYQWIVGCVYLGLGLFFMDGFWTSIRKCLFNASNLILLSNVYLH